MKLQAAQTCGCLRFCFVVLSFLQTSNAGRDSYRRWFGTSWSQEAVYSYHCSSESVLDLNVTHICTQSQRCLVLLWNKLGPILRDLRNCPRIHLREGFASMRLTSGSLGCAPLYQKSVQATSRTHSCLTIYSDLQPIELSMYQHMHISLAFCKFAYFILFGRRITKSSLSSSFNYFGIRWLQSW